MHWNFENGAASLSNPSRPLFSSLYDTGVAAIRRSNPAKCDSIKSLSGGGVRGTCVIEFE
jgi:hypothetical protein